MRFLGSDGNALLSEVGSRPGNGLLPTDPGGYLRRVSFSVGGLKTLAVASAEVADGHRVRRARVRRRPRVRIDYYGPEGTASTSVSFSTVYRATCRAGSSTTRSWSSAPPRRRCRTSTRPPPPARCRARRSRRARSRRCCAASRCAPRRLARPRADRAVRPRRAAGERCVSARSPRSGWRSRSAAAFTVAVQVAFDHGRVVSFVYPLGGADPQRGGCASVQGDCRLRARAGARPFARFVPEAVVDEVLRSADGEPPARRRAARGHGDVQRPARLHLVRRDARAGERDRRRSTAT